MIGARRGSPLALGIGDNEMFLGSDAMALAPLTDLIIYLEDGDWAVLSNKNYVGLILYALSCRHDGQTTNSFSGY